MKKLLAICLVLMTSAFANAQNGSVEPSTRLLLQNYDLTAVGAGSAVACSPNEFRVPIKITTVGSSTTTAGTVSTTLPFALAAVGDVISAVVTNTVAGTTTNTRATRVITVKGSNNSVTVNSAWTLPSTGVVFNLIKFGCAAATNTTPWIDVLSNSITQLSFNISTINVTGGISARIEGLFSDPGDPNPIVTNMWPGVTAADAKCGSGIYDGSGNCNFTAVNPSSGITFSTTPFIKPRSIRLVLFIGTSDTGVQAINATLTEVK